MTSPQSLDSSIFSGMAFITRRSAMDELYEEGHLPGKVAFLNEGCLIMWKGEKNSSIAQTVTRYKKWRIK